MSAKYYPDDFSINIARGIVKGTSSNHKFGAVPQMSNAASGTIWDVNDTVYPWDAYDVANTAVIPAVDVGDNGKTVTVQGLDQDYNYVEEDFVVSSAGATTGGVQFSRINRAFISAGIDNTANVNITYNGTTVARIGAGNGQTLMSVYTVPAGTDAFLLKFVSSASADASLFFRRRNFNENAFRIAHTGELVNFYEYEFEVPLKFSEKTDIDVRATTGTNNARITCCFDIVLIKQGLV